MDEDGKDVGGLALEVGGEFSGEDLLVVVVGVEVELGLGDQLEAAGGYGGVTVTVND